jgi:DNA mismatch repair protein MutL
MTDIERLDERTVERIAAGEVVERPASVVKELVENAIDADAGRVSVAVENGGIDGIQVTDDGIGMDRSAAERAIEQHTTSKISDISDLESGVGTLGFRGEALHAIGAVSRLTIRTRPRGGDVGTELTVEGGECTEIGPTGCPEGTIIEVDDLFYNVPARRKYLKQPTTEFSHVNTITTSYALANPDVAVSLTHDGRETFSTTGSGDLQETVMAVYGREVAESMLSTDTDDLPDGPVDGISGLISHPETTRAGREYLSTYVNGRYVRAKAAHDAVIDAYGTQIAPDRYPFAVLFLDVPAGTVDVNVHPRKREVRFADEDGVREQVKRAVTDTLRNEGILRSSAPRGRSKPEQTEISPEGTDRRSDQTEVSAQTDEPEQPETSEVDGKPTTESEGTGTPTAETDDRSSPESKPVSDRSEREASPTAHGRASSNDEGSGSQSAGQQSVDEQPAQSDHTASSPDTGSDTSVSGVHEQTHLTEPPETSYESLPDLRILGQLHETYIVAETGDGLLLIDQHAADERINYERLRAKFEGETTTQALATPVEIELTAQEMGVFEQRSDALASLGFHTARTGERSVEVRTLPGVIADAAGPDIVRDILGSFVTDGTDAAETVEAAADELLADLACYPSITGNTSLTDGSVQRLLSELDECADPTACPHGRPTIIEISGEELTDRFERDYPGHTGRR